MFHVNHLNDETGKMSKSKGDFLTVSLIESKGYDPLAYRFFCLQSHYRKPLVFSYEALDQATQTYNKLVRRIASLKKDGEVDTAFVEGIKNTFIEKVGTDMNTALGITCIYDILKASANDISKLEAIKSIDYVLSVGLIDRAEKLNAKASEEKTENSASDNIDPALKAKIEELIEKRKEAKKAKDFALADAIRAELSDMGVTIKDTREGTTYTLN